MIASLAVGYDIQVVLEKDLYPNDRRDVVATVLTDSNLVAGYFSNVIGNHGMPIAPTPYVWKDGQLTWLPIGENDDGDVLSGNDDVLVGSVWKRGWRRAVKWTRHESKGWAEAKLEFLSSIYSSAVLVDTKGNIYINELPRGEEGDEVIKRLGPLGDRSWIVQKFVPQRLARDGTVWGYTYKTMTFGGLHLGRSVAKLTDSGVEVVRADFNVADFNAQGDYCGEGAAKDDREIGFFKGAAVSLPPGAKLGAWVSSLNDRGDITGYYPGKDWDPEKAFVISNGRMSVLPPVSASSALTPQKINSNGAIVGMARQKDRLGVYIYIPNR